MPLKFVFGPSGSGKSSYLYQHVIQESMKYPERNYIVLVPEQFTMQTQKDLVMMHERKGIMNIECLALHVLLIVCLKRQGAEDFLFWMMRERI